MYFPQNLHVYDGIFCANLRVLRENQYESEDDTSLFHRVRHHDIVAVLTAVGAFLLVNEVEYMREVVLHGGDAARVFATDDVFHAVGHFQFHLLDGLPLLDDVHRGVRVDQTEEVVVDVDDIVDFDDVFLSHLFAVGVADERDIIIGLVKVQIIEHLDAVAGGNVVDDNTFFYTGDF